VLTGGASDQIPPPAGPFRQGTMPAPTAADVRAYASPEAEAARARLNAQVPRTVEHALANPHAYTGDEFVNALRGMSFGQIGKILQYLTPPTMQEQAMSRALEGASSTGSALEREQNTQRLLNMFAAGPSAYFNPGIIGIGVPTTPPAGRGAVDPNAGR